MTKTPIATTRTSAPADSRPTWRTTAGAALVAGLLLAGCGGQASGIDLQTPAPEHSGSVGVGAAPAATSAPSPTPTATSTPMTEEQRILTDYQAFWSALDPIASMPLHDRPDAFAKVAVNPEFQFGLAGFAGYDEKGQVSYGKIGLRPTIQSIQGDTVTILDCQDGSHTGLASKATGERLTVGTANALQHVSMKRGTDGTWRVSTLQYEPGAKC